MWYDVIGMARPTSHDARREPMDQSRRKVLTLLAALPLLVIPAALALSSTLNPDQGAMGGMAGMGGAIPTATAARPATGPATLVVGARYGELAPDELSTALANKDFTLINVHVPYEGEIAGTDAFIPYDRIGEDTARLPSDRAAAIVLYCRTGRMSAEAATTLGGLGYRHVRQLTGGMDAWQAQGYPLQELPLR